MSTISETAVNCQFLNIIKNFTNFALMGVLLWQIIK
jgi:hypothetical protein